MARLPTNGACHTCRRRRVKCDKGEPACQRCLRAGYKCQGYPRGIQFRYHAGPSASKTQPLSSTSDQISHVFLRRELDLRAFQESFAFSYLFSTYPWGCFINSWIRRSAVEIQITLASQCSRALALGILGLDKRQKDLQIQAAELYGTSLRLLAEQLPVVSRAKAAKLVAPVMTMILYDFSIDLSYSRRDGGSSHYEGIAQLLRFCGPQSFLEPHLRGDLEAARALLVSHGLLRRRHTFLADRCWKTTPWPSGSFKSGANELFEILSDVPGIIEQLETFRPLDEPSKAKLRVHVAALMDQLSAWRLVWERKNSQSVREGQSLLNPHGVGDGRLQSLSSRVLRFDSVTLAVEHMLYNATLLWLMRLQSVLTAPESEISSTISRTWDLWDLYEQPSLLLPVETRLFSHPAVQTLRSLEYLLENLLATEDVILAFVMPVAVVYNQIKDDAVLVSWLRGMLERYPWSCHSFNEKSLQRYDTRLNCSEVGNSEEGISLIGDEAIP